MEKLLPRENSASIFFFSLSLSDFLKVYAGCSFNCVKIKKPLQAKANLVFYSGRLISRPYLISLNRAHQKP